MKVLFFSRDGERVEQLAQLLLRNRCAGIRARQHVLRLQAEVVRHEFQRLDLFGADPPGALHDIANGLIARLVYEAAALEAGAQIVGINNRDLTTFSTDLAVTHRLAPKIPNDKVIVSESGISSPDDIRQMATISVHAVLVGEALVTAPDVAEKVRELAGRPLTENRP